MDKGTEVGLKIEFTTSGEMVVTDREGMTVESSADPAWSEAYPRIAKVETISLHTFASEDGARLTKCILLPNGRWYCY